MTMGNKPSSGQQILGESRIEERSGNHECDRDGNVKGIILLTTLYHLTKGK
jgi:hypothetical protein